MVLFAGEALKNKLKRVCDSFGVAQYEIPKEEKSFKEKLDDINAELIESQNVKINIKILS